MAQPAAAGIAILMAILSTSCMMGSSASGVMRLNYGIKFHSLPGLYSSHEDSFAYTFIIPFPNTDANVTVDTPECKPIIANRTYTPYMDQCEKLMNLVAKVHGDTDKIISELAKTISKVKSMVPIVSESNKQSYKRALLPWLGTAIKFLTGAPDKKSFNKIRSHVNMLEEDNTLLHNKLGQFGDTLNGFMQLENQNHDQLIKNLQDNNKQITDQVSQLLGKIRSNFVQFASNWQVWRAFNIQLGHTFLIAFDHYRYGLSLMSSATLMNSEWLQAMQILAEHKLPISMIGTTDLQLALDHVASILASHKSDLGLDSRPLSWYYTLEKVTYLHDDDKLYLTFQIPLISRHSQNLYEIFQVETFPTPIAESVNKPSPVTTLQNIAPYYGISVDKRFTLEMKTDTFVTCTGTKIRHCSGPMILRAITHDNCLDALYLDSHKDIMKNCDFQIQTPPKTPTILQFQDTVIISGYTSDLVLNCPGKTSDNIEPCSLCILHIPCMCTLQTNEHVFVQNHDKCDKNVSGVQTLYGHNVPFIHEFFGEVPDDWSGDLTSTKQEIVNMPELPPDFLDKLNSNLEKDMKNHDISNLRQVIQQTHSDLSGSKPNTLFDPTKSNIVTSIILVLDTCLIGVLLTIIAFICFRVYKMGIMILVLQSRLNNVTADSVVPQLHWNVAPTLQPSTNFAVPSGLQTYVLLGILFMSFLSFIAATITFLYTRYEACNNKVHVKLIILSDNTTISLPLFTLRSRTEDIKLSGNHIIETIDTTRKWGILPYLHINWNDLKLEINDMIVNCPNIYLINPITYHNICQVRQSDNTFHTFLYIQYGDIVVKGVGFIPSHIPQPIITTGHGISYRTRKSETHELTTRKRSLSLPYRLKTSKTPEK